MHKPHLWLPYSQMKTAAEPLAAVRTQATTLELADGRRLVDGIASWWTACHGYNHPHILAAVRAQLERMPHVMLGGIVHEPAERLARRLAAKLPGDLDHVFFSESGSVSVEIAMKVAIQYWRNLGRADRTRFLSFRNAYHGDTFAAMSICDPVDSMHGLFAGTLAEQVCVPLPGDEAGFAELERVVAAEAGRLAGLVIEPLVQAACGMRFHSPEALGRIAGLAERHGLLLILDEIATGFGRTGTLFAAEQAGVTADVVTLSKALTGGVLPLAATAVRRHVFDAFWSDDPAHALMHGPTYSGNALACAAANASLDLFEREPRLEQVARIEAQLAAGLEPARALPGVADVRVKGAIGVVELEREPDAAALRSRFVEAGVWIRPIGNVIYLMPAFVITERELDVLVRAILAEVERGVP